VNICFFGNSAAAASFWDAEKKSCWLQQARSKKGQKGQKEVQKIPKNSKKGRMVRGPGFRGGRRNAFKGTR